MNDYVFGDYSRCQHKADSLGSILGRSSCVMPDAEEVVRSTPAPPSPYLSYLVQGLRRTVTPFRDPKIQ